MPKSFIEFSRQSDANSVPAAGPGGLAVLARAQPDETTFPQTRSRPETEAAYAPPRSKTGFDHADPHRQRDLPAIPQGRPHWHGSNGGTAMTEIVTALLAFLSIGVFLAHAFDAYRMRPGRRF
jgi:hypothetical protein